MGKTASGFDLREILSKRSLQQEPEPEMQQEEMEILMLEIQDLIPSEDNFYSMDNLEDLKLSISILGVLQPLLVKPERDKYKIAAGHRRHKACMELWEETREDRYKYVPCVIKTENQEGQFEVKEEEKQELNGILDRLAETMSNSFRDKTDWERMEETLKQQAEIKALRKFVKISGNTRTILKELTGGRVKETQIGRYRMIKNNLIPELMEEFKKNNLKISVVTELAGVDQECQERAYERYLEKGELTLQEARELKRKETSQLEDPEEEPEKENPLEGNMNPPEEPKEPEEQEEPEEQQNAAGEEYETPHPEGIISICYSCTEYETCNVKTGTCTSCDRYKDRREEYKTEEQKYSEEQDKLDQETRRILNERQNQEGQDSQENQNMQQEPRVHQIKIASMYYTDVCEGRKPFELQKNDRDYRVGDILEMMEFKKGYITGRIVRVMITYLLEDYTGLQDGYCILGIKVMDYDV